MGMGSCVDQQLNALVGRKLVFEAANPSLASEPVAVKVNTIKVEQHLSAATLINRPFWGEDVLVKFVSTRVIYSLASVMIEITP